MDPQTWKPRVEGEHAQCLVLYTQPRSPLQGQPTQRMYWCPAPSPSSSQPHTWSTRLPPPPTNPTHGAAGSPVKTCTWLAQGLEGGHGCPRFRIHDIPGRVQIKEEGICGICILCKRQKQTVPKRKESPTHATAQVNLDDIILSEMTRSNKGKHWVIPLIRGT